MPAPNRRPRTPSTPPPHRRPPARSRHDAAWRRRKRRRQNAITLGLLAGILLILALIIWGITQLFRKPSAQQESSSQIAVSTDASASSSSSTPVSEPAEEDQWDYVTKTKADLSTGDQILVNPDWEYTVVPPNLTPISTKMTTDYIVKNNEIELRDYVIPYLNEMMADFKEATGISNVMIMSAYRSVDYQNGLYQNDLARTGKSESDSVAKPGYSEHHTGFAIDLAYSDNGSWNYYDGSGDYGWINENCWKYGFVIRYPSDKQEITKIIYEPWHFRYLGLAHAEMMTKSGLCYEEYIEELKKHNIENPYTYTGESASYSVYYCPMGTETEISIPVPKDKPYTISGSNEGGFIVTVTETTTES